MNIEVKMNVTLWRYSIIYHSSVIHCYPTVCALGGRGGGEEGCKIVLCAAVIAVSPPLTLKQTWNKSTIKDN